MSIEHWNPQIDGEFSEQALRQKLEAKGYQVFRYVYPPGTDFPNHTHSINKIDAVVSGKFCLRMKGKEFILKQGDCLSIPRGVVHNAEVIGNEPVVSLDATQD